MDGIPGIPMDEFIRILFGFWPNDEIFEDGFED